MDGGLARRVAAADDEDVPALALAGSRRRRAVVHAASDEAFDLLDAVGRSGFGIGSAGLPAYSLLIEGFSQALDNDVVLTMKQANVPAVSRFVDSAEVEDFADYFLDRCTLVRLTVTDLDATAAPLEPGDVSDTYRALALAALARARLAEGDRETIRALLEAAPPPEES